MKYQTPERSIRGFAETREYEPSIVPGGFGLKIKEAAEAVNGIPPAILTPYLNKKVDSVLMCQLGETLSRSGAAGIAQFMPGTARDMVLTQLNTDLAIDGAARYLVYLMT